MTHAATPARPEEQKSRGFLGLSQSQWIVVAMVVGILLGWQQPEIAVQLKPFSDIFLNMIKSLIVPLLFSTLVGGIAGHGDDMKKVGKLAVRSIVYFEVVTTLAFVIGLVAVNLVKPGCWCSAHDWKCRRVCRTREKQDHVGLCARAHGSYQHL